jgi:hypothetical protein
MPRYKYVFNRLLTFTQNLLVGSKLSEFHTGYRAFSRRVLETLPLAANSDDFVFDNQMIVQALACGMRLGEISCPTKYFPEASQISFRRSVRYGFGVLSTSLAYRLWRWKLLRPRFLSMQPQWRCSPARLRNDASGGSARARHLAGTALALLAGAFLRGTSSIRKSCSTTNGSDPAAARGRAGHRHAFRFRRLQHSADAVFRFLYLHGGLTEWGMRLPMLLAGIGFCWLRRRSCAVRLAAGARRLGRADGAVADDGHHHARRGPMRSRPPCVVAIWRSTTGGAVANGAGAGQRCTSWRCS